jgi:hypothetical protein
MAIVLRKCNIMEPVLFVKGDFCNFMLVRSKQSRKLDKIREHTITSVYQLSLRLMLVRV